MGGPSSEHEVSLATGENVLKNLDSRLFESIKIKILRDGKVWMSGRYAKLEKAVKSLDLCFLATHGEFGEDGRLQAVLESYGVPYTGSGVLASALAMNKAKSRQLFFANGLKTPKTLFIKEGENFQSQLKFFVSKLIKFPLVVKPCSRGSSVGVSIVKSKRALKKAIHHAFKYDPEVLIEEYIEGREFTCGVIEKKVNGSPHIIALPVTEIIPNQGLDFFNYEAKYQKGASPHTHTSEGFKTGPQSGNRSMSVGASQEITPAQLSEHLAKEVKELAAKAHRILGCKDYSSSDFLVKNGKIYILELDTLPGLTENSLIPKALKTAGWSIRKFLNNICFRNVKKQEIQTA
ncbi:MAG: D-alanine-D-alanine ligase [Parcubacteria group bacterium Gr01-1014_2]|nr:MAG: D-alanine-D-alanine ligase [Parcubacteria group bacterium Gr01-1014_2]